MLRVVVALVTGALLAMIPLDGLPSARAAESDPSVEELRANADAIADRYFAALARTEQLDAQIADHTRRVDDLVTRARAARAAARGRAAIAYRTTGRELTAFINGQDPLASARRIRLIDKVNAVDQAAFVELRIAARELRTERQALRAAEGELARALDVMRAEGAAMDAELAHAARLDPARAAPAVPSPVGAPTTSSSTLSAPATRSTTPALPPSATPGSQPVAPPSYSGTPGVHSRHSEVFLVCLRARESGGNYAAVDPTGRYRGAYQFHQTTWNGTANHAGRPELIGVPPNVATSYDQDDLAWSLYQWQGAGPWGGGCS